MRTATAIFFLGFLSTIYYAGYSQTMTEAWSRTAGGTGKDVGMAIAVDHHGGVFAGGYFTSSSFTIGTTTLTNSNATGADAFIARYDTAGNFLWAKSFGGVDNQSINSIAVSAAGNIYVAGEGFNLAKLDNAGNITWQVPGPNTSTATIGLNNIMVVLDSRENIYLGQISVSSGGSYFSKYNSAGIFRYTKQLGGPLSNTGSIAVDQLDNVHIALFHPGGMNVGPPTNQNITLLYSCRVWFDSVGVYLGSETFLPHQRDHVYSYKAKSPSEYFYTQRHFALGGQMQEEQSGGSVSGIANATGCSTTDNPMKNDLDNLGNEFYAGDMLRGFPATCFVTYARQYTPMPIIDSTRGSDIYFLKRTNAQGVTFLGSTRYNGFTDEYLSCIAVDTNAHSMYLIGRWSKMTDTAQFRFGNSTLANAGSANTDDMLLLKLGYNPGTVTVNVGADRSICPGGSATMNPAIAGGSGNFSYSWVPATGVSNSSIANPVITPPSAPITYVLTVTDINLGTVIRDSLTIFFDSSLYRPVISNISAPIVPNPFCEGSTLQLASSPAVSYLWNTGATTQAINVSVSDTLTVTAVRSDGCIGVSLPYFAIMKPAPLPPTVTPLNPVQICAGDSVTLTAQSNQPGVTVYWYVNPSAGSSITVSTAGGYNATAVLNGCHSPDVLRTVIVNNPPTGNIPGSDTSICSGDSVLLTVNTSASNTVLWNTGATTTGIWVKTTGNYSAVISAGNNCSITTNTRGVTVTQRPAAAVTQNGNILTASPAGMAYQWYFNGAVISGATNQTLTITQGGPYTVVVTASNGCSSSASIGAIYRLAAAGFNYQVYPNPVTSDLNIIYSLDQANKVSIVLRNLGGQKLSVIANEQNQSAGEHRVTLSNAGARLQKGLYYVEIKVGNTTIISKVLIL